MIIRNWRDQVPCVSHESKIIWHLLARADATNTGGEEACLLSLASLTRHVVQGRMTTDYHDHEGKEQVYYFIAGKGKMLIDDKVYAVTSGDAVHLPPLCRHQVINDTEDDMEYLNISANVEH